MKLFIFSLWLLYPDGQMDINATIIPKCPTQAEVKATLQDLVKKGEITNGMASCQLVDTREARL